MRGQVSKRVAQIEREKTNLEVLSNFTNETLEGQLADEELSRLLVATNFTESDGSRAETMGLLDTTSRGWLQVVEFGSLKERTIQVLTAEVLRDLVAFAASCLRGALPPVDLRAVCLVRAIGVVGGGGG